MIPWRVRKYIVRGISKIRFYHFEHLPANFTETSVYRCNCRPPHKITKGQATHYQQSWTKRPDATPQQTNDDYRIGYKTPIEEASLERHGDPWNTSGIKHVWFVGFSAMFWSHRSRVL